MSIGKATLKILRAELPITDRPFADIARRLGMEEKELLATLRAYKRAGLIRRFGAVLDHRRLGRAANALVAWKVGRGKIRRAARAFSGIPDVSHCYERTPCPSWPYTLYTMVHARSRGECRSLVRRMARIAGVDDYRVLLTRKELKKSRLDPAALYRSRSRRERAISRSGSAL
jgi:DNA-binding Lrp family transcriptional regulator